MQTLSQILEVSVQLNGLGPAGAHSHCQPRPYLKSKQSTSNLFERPLWLLMYPKLEHFTPLVPEI